MTFATTLNKCSGLVPRTIYEAECELFRRLGLLPEDDRPWTPVDWPKIDRALAESYGWTLEQIDEMTLPEIMVMVPREDAVEVVPDYIRLYKSLPPAAKIELDNLERGC